jgi:hypothetical protein
MTTSFNKDPNDITDYSVDWQYLLDAGEAIVTSTWLFYTMDNVITTDLVEESSSNTDSVTSVFISGGVVDTKYKIANKITTTLRTLERTFYLHVLELYI